MKFYVGAQFIFSSGLNSDKNIIYTITNTSPFTIYWKSDYFPNGRNQSYEKFQASIIFSSENVEFIDRYGINYQFNKFLVSGDSEQ